MLEVCEKNKCSGCMACVNICNPKAISVIVDEEGFDSPIINQSLCVDCGLCVRICPLNKDQSNIQLFQPLSVYSGWSNNEEIRFNSSSGGAFTELAKEILKKDGIVFGAAFDKDFTFCHTYVSTEDELERLRGSKYVQSRILNTHTEVKTFLNQDKWVLFSGTPCQVAGLKSFLRKDYDKLLTIDLICHGVPSPKVFEDYKKYILEKECFTKFHKINFRDKRKSGWNFFCISITGNTKENQQKEYVGEYYSDPFLRGFLRDYFLRSSCYECKFTSIKRPSDITIADWWGYKPFDKTEGDFEQKGVSLVFANTLKGEDVVSTANMKLRNRTISEALKTNLALKEPFAMPSARKEFWQDYNSIPFSEVVLKWMKKEQNLPYGIRLKIKFFGNRLLNPIVVLLIFISRVKNKLVSVFRKYLKITSK